MLITICDVPVHYKPDIAKVGGVVVRECDGLMDVQFSEHKMYVRDAYVKLRSKDHVALILAQFDFNHIRIR